MPGTAEAASSKAVKSVSLKIGNKKVTKKTYALTKGKTASLKVSVNPSKAKKSVSFKSSNKKIATVSKKGKITAKKSGTAKITVTVKGKKGKKKTTYVKIKVTAKKSSTTAKKGSHTHKWEKITRTNRVWVVDREAYDEGVYETKYKCECGFITSLEDKKGMNQHEIDTGHAYGTDRIKVGTIHHNEVGHYENKVEVIDRKCTICGILDSQL